MEPTGETARTLARVRKAALLADVLDAAGCVADDVMALDEQGWADAVAVVVAQTGKPMGVPSDATKTLVWHRLAERQATDDPFAVFEKPIR